MLSAVVNLLTFCRFNASLRLRSRPPIGSQYCIEIGVRNGRVLVHHLFNDPPDLGKPYFAI
jgi:hypothetical protein